MNVGISYGSALIIQLIIITVFICILSGLETMVVEVEVVAVDFSNFLFFSSLRNGVREKKQGERG